jgi:hypothetical protein
VEEEDNSALILFTCGKEKLALLLYGHSHRQSGMKWREDRSGDSDRSRSRPTQADEQKQRTENGWRKEHGSR